MGLAFLDERALGARSAFSWRRRRKLSLRIFKCRRNAEMMCSTASLLKKTPLTLGRKHFPWGESDVILAMSPITHMSGFFGMASVLYGTTSVITSSTMGPSEIIDAVDKYQVMGSLPAPWLRAQGHSPLSHFASAVTVIAEKSTSEQQLKPQIPNLLLILHKRAREDFAPVVSVGQIESAMLRGNLNALQI